MRTYLIRSLARFMIMVMLMLSIVVFLPFSASASTTVNINGGNLGRTFEGIGGISSNGMTKLLAEYPANQQEDIIKLLFKPYFGASLQHLKVEIGSDANGTSGTEPSHMRSETDFDITRGVGLWIASKAKEVNPDIMLDAIRWGTPAWIEDDTDKLLYYLNFLRGARDEFNLEFDYLSPDENEGDFSRDWVVNTLRPGLDSNGFSNVKLSAADSTTDWNIATMVNSDSTLKSALYSINMHYRQESPDSAKNSGMPIWNSEDLAPYRHNFSGSLNMAYRMIKSYTSGKMVKYEMHPLIEAIYDNTPYSYKSILTAANPWTGHYDIEPGLWVTAQFTQFIQPGWIYLDSGCANTSDSGYITLKSPDTNDYSIIILNNGTTADDYVFNLSGGLSSGTLHVWGTDEEEQFYTLPDITPINNSFTLTVPAGTIYSLTTTTGQQKGQPSNSIPTETDFELPYEDAFESYNVSKQPKYTIDQSGAFEIASDSSGKYLKQVITEDIKPVDWERRASPSPYTILGGLEWANYKIFSDIKIDDTEGYVLLGGRCNFSPTGNVPAECYNLKIFFNGDWQLRKAALVLASGTISSFNTGTWYNAGLSFNDNSIKAYFENVELASVTDSEIPSGHVVLGSGYNIACFDNLTISSIDSSTPASCLRYEDRDDRIEFIGTWAQSGSNAKNYTRTLQTTSEADNYMELAFNGTSVSILGEIDTDCGYADVYIDDVYNATIDAYSSVTKYRKALFSAYDLTAGDHTLKLVVKGTKNSSSSGYSVNIDAVEVIGGTGLLDIDRDPLSTVTEQTVSLMDEDFEDETVNQQPTLWTVTAASNTSCLIGNVSGETNQCAVLTDSNTSGVVSMQRAFSSQSDHVTIIYRFRALTTGKWSRLYVKDGTTNIIEVYDSNVNGLCYRNSSASDVKIADISANTWYDIKLDIDIAFNTFNVYLNSELTNSNCTFRRAATAVDSIAFESGSSFVGTAYFDDVTVEKTALLNENFDNLTTGTEPKGFSITSASNTSCTIQEYPSALDKSLRLLDSNTSASVSVLKPFAMQTGIIVAEYEFNDSSVGTWSRFLLSNGSTDAVEIYNSDIDGLCYRNCLGDDIKIIDINANTWYTVKIVADPVLDRFDVYIDNNLIAKGCSFRNVVTGINSATVSSGQSFTGTTYFNDMSILIGQ